MYQGKYLANAKTGKAPRTSNTPKPPKQKKRITAGTVIFYTLYFLGILACVLGIRYGMGLLEDWLIRFEASQPDTKSQEIFQEIFADPDWAALYDRCGLEGTEFEGKEAYVRYMENKVGDAELTYSMTSAGLSGGQKYIVRLGEEKLGTFTIQNTVTGELEIPDWQLENIELLNYPRVQNVTVVTQPGRTVTVNGVPLDESYVVKTVSSLVESYLPEGIHGPSSATLYADGFLVAPEVLVIDVEGNLVEMTYDAATCTYSESAQEQTFSEIPEAEKNALIEATHAYSKALIGANKSAWKKLFVKDTEIYKNINGLVANDSFFKGYTSFGFTDAVVSEYCRYTDDFFSAKIQLTLNTYRADGSVKPFEVDSTIFMTLSKGTWLVQNITNVNVHETTTLVRMTWMQDGQILSSGMVDASDDILMPPAVTAPDGKEFLGWFKETMDANGDTTLSLIFAPTDSGNISLPSDYTLEPMVLQARFQDKGE